MTAIDSMKPAFRGSAEEMASRYSLARQFRDNLLALVALPLVHLVGIVVVVSPWLILFSGGWRPFLRWYLLPYPFALVGFAIIMAFVSRRQLRGNGSGTRSRKLRSVRGLGPQHNTRTVNAGSYEKASSPRPALSEP